MIIHMHRLPNPLLNPNKRLHYYKLAEAKRNAKEEMMWRALEQVKKPYYPFKKAHITITWVAKDKIRRDMDNLFASMKPYIDGLVASEILEDDSADSVSSYELNYERGDANDTIIEINNAS